MAIKRTIHEICLKCGKVAARQDSDGTVHTVVHGCVVKGTIQRSFLPSEVVFVSAIEPNSVVELVLANRELQAKNSLLSSNFREMASDCAKLQKIVFDIGHKVRDVLGIDIVQPTINPCTGMWQCTCDMWNYPSQKSCSNCGKSKQ